MKNMINLVVPLSNVNYYEALIKNGASEFYAGFMPLEWLEKYNTVNSLNRREYMFSSSNICSINSMYTLSKYMNHYGVKVKIAINSHFFSNHQYDFILNYIQKLMNLGFDEFIIADLCLLLLIRHNNLKCKVHLSGEIETLNHYAIDFLSQFNIKRIVFPRKINLNDMENCIKNNDSSIKEYEAFILNSLCRYSGGFCNSIHCDDMPAVCSIPRFIQKYRDNSNSFKDLKEALNQRLKSELLKKSFYYQSKLDRKHMFGATGCGVCRIKHLQNLGITHLKIVGRGYNIEKLIYEVKTVSDIVKRSYETSDAEFAEIIKEKYLNNRCMKCYYPSLKE